MSNWGDLIAAGLWFMGGLGLGYLANALTKRKRDREQSGQEDRDSARD